MPANGDLEAQSTSTDVEGQNLGSIAIQQWVAPYIECGIIGEQKYYDSFGGSGGAILCIEGTRNFQRYVG